MSFLDFFRRPPSRAKYVRLILKKLALYHPDEPVHYDDAGFRILIGADAQQVINLHNMYAEYCAASKDERVLQLHRFVSLIGPPGAPATFAEARPYLMPALRGNGMMEYLRLTELGKDREAPSGFLFLPFSRDTSLVLMIDGEQTMQSIGRDQLAQWGVTIDGVMAAAMDNLRDRSVDAFTQPRRGVFMGSWNDAYDSSRILLPDLAHRVAGANPLAMVPARGTLLLASGNDVEAVRAMVDVAWQVASEETRPVSALMYRFEDGRPVEHLPAMEATRTALAQLERFYRHGDYAAQKESLDELHEKNGIDMFVATFKGMRHEATDVEFTVCSWTRGVDTLLPRTDRVVMVVIGEDGEIQEHHMVPWDALHAACGHLMEPVPDAFPERWRVAGFPDLELVRSLALD